MLARYDVEIFKLLRNKVVIFFNNTFPDTKNIPQKAMNYLGEMEIYNAAKLFNISSYIIGPENSFNLTNNSSPFSHYSED